MATGFDFNAGLEEKTEVPMSIDDRIRAGIAVSREQVVDRGREIIKAENETQGPVHTLEKAFGVLPARDLRGFQDQLQRMLLEEEAESRQRVAAIRRVAQAAGDPR